MATRIKDEDEDDDPRGLIPVLASTTKNAVLTPIRPLVSRPALRAYLTTILAVSGAFILLGLAITAYTLFYMSYLPRIGFERPIHLQFDNVYAPHTTHSHQAHPYPYGTTSLSRDLVSQQSYDISIELTLPRTHSNRAAGNFMLRTDLLHPSHPTALATSRRPTILPYRSLPIEALHKLTQLPFYLLNLRSESTTLLIPAFERQTFPRGTLNIPTELKLEIQSTADLQIYTAKAIFRARFTGLRWLMYNHRITAAILGISTFWATEVLFAGLAWAAISLMFMGDGKDVAPIKQEPGAEEEEEKDPPLSETERTFPTLSGQKPLRYISPAEDVVIKQEDPEDAIPSQRVSKGMEADIEDEDEDDEDKDFRDSGIGTSLESSGPARRESVRRRRGRTLTPGEDER